MCVIKRGELWLLSRLPSLPHFMKKFILGIVLVFSVSLVSAQLTDWSGKTSFKITERSGATLSNYQVLVIANTDSLITAGAMKSDASDVRFSLDCDGSTLLSYYLENDPTTTDGNFWVLLPTLEANDDIQIFMFYGNAAATAVSDFATVFPNSLIVEADEELSVTEWDFDWIEIKSGVTVNLPATMINNLPLAPEPFIMRARRIKIAGNFIADFAGNSGGKLDAPGLGDGGGKPNPSGPYIFNLGAGGGGAYGGNGGNGGYTNNNTGYLGPGGVANGSANGKSIKLGSGGAAACASCATPNPGGNGGGAVSMEAASISITGRISARGEYLDPTEPIFIAGAGGGSGGGVLASAILLKKSGDISCNGANGSSGTGVGGGGGSGGRIKLFHELPFVNAGKLEVNAGDGGSGGTLETQGINGDNGTVFDTLAPSIEPLAVEIRIPNQIQVLAPYLNNNSICINDSALVRFTPAGLGNYTLILNGVETTLGAVDSVMIAVDADALEVSVKSDLGGCVLFGDTLVFNAKQKIVPAFSFSASDLDYNFSNASSFADTYFWDFGDGVTSTQENPSHSFPLVGDYQVCLTASNSDGLCPDSTICQTISASCALPVSRFITGGAFLSYQFTDTTANSSARVWKIDGVELSSDSIFNYTFSDIGNHSICLESTNHCGTNEHCISIDAQCETPFAGFTMQQNFLNFTFVDTTQDSNARQWAIEGKLLSTDSIFTFAFNGEGNYEVCLISDTKCGPDTLCVDVEVLCPKPSVSFQTTADELSVSFVDLSTNGSNRSWEIDGIAVSTDSIYQHIFDSPGEYELCLRLENQCGSSQFCETITVACENMVSAFEFTRSDSAFDFTSTSTGKIESWFWDFGDGGSSTEENPAYIFTTPGVYDVCLSVENECAEVEVSCQEVEIVATGIADIEPLHFSLFPNPSKDKVYIRLSEINDTQLKVYDLRGSAIGFTATKNAGGYEITLNKPTPGIYFLELVQDQKVGRKKFVIE